MPGTPPTRRAESKSPDPPATPVLTVDPHTVPAPFAAQKILEKFNRGAEEDEEEEERILNELDSLSKDFYIWSHCRVRQGEETGYEATTRTLEDIKNTEARQRGHLGRLSAFISSIQSALSHLVSS